MVFKIPIVLTDDEQAYVGIWVGGNDAGVEVRRCEILPASELAPTELPNESEATIEGLSQDTREACDDTLPVKADSETDGTSYPESCH